MFNIRSLMLHVIPPELAHFCSLKLLPFFTPSDVFHDKSLNVEIWNKVLPNPLGLAGGMDKNGQYIGPLLSTGFGFLEIGTVTPMFQKGNKRPRVFRLHEDLAIINRLGFNNLGMNKVIANLNRYRKKDNSALIGISIGKQAASDDPFRDYCNLFKFVHAFADYVVLNISSPNTVGLRDLQSHDVLYAMLESIYTTKEKIKSETPLVLKLSPDLNESEMEGIASLAIKFDISAIILTNTTIGNRNSLKSKNKNEYGGLSGRPLFKLSTSILRNMYLLTKGKIPLIGCGGIMNGDDAYLKIRNGATLLQIYTSIVYHGFGVISDINKRLHERLISDGFDSISEAVGVDCN